MSLPPDDDPARDLLAPTDTLPGDPSEEVAFPDFPIAMRGYDRAAVEAYVGRVVRIVEQLESVRSPRAAVRAALERVGEQTSGILAQAHSTAESVTANARAEAEELTTRSQREAEELTARSRREAEDRLERARAEAEELLRATQERAHTLDRDADLIWNERAKLLADVERITGELARVLRGAEERFPPEAEVADGPAVRSGASPEPEPDPAELEPEPAEPEPEFEDTGEPDPLEPDVTQEIPRPDGPRG